MKRKVLTDREMILDPNDWPNWPYLPVVKRSGDGACGVILGDPQGDKVFFVPGANIWHMPDDVTERGSLRDVDELLAEGWEVD